MNNKNVVGIKYFKMIFKNLLNYCFVEIVHHLIYIMAKLDQ